MAFRVYNLDVLDCFTGERGTRGNLQSATAGGGATLHGQSGPSTFVGKKGLSATAAATRPAAEGASPTGAPAQKGESEHKRQREARGVKRH